MRWLVVPVRCMFKEVVDYSEILRPVIITRVQCWIIRIYMCACGYVFVDHCRWWFIFTICVICLLTTVLVLLAYGERWNEPNEIILCAQILYINPCLIFKCASMHYAYACACHCDYWSGGSDTTPLHILIRYHVGVHIWIECHANTFTIRLGVMLTHWLLEMVSHRHINNLDMGSMRALLLMIVLNMNFLRKLIDCYNCD